MVRPTLSTTSQARGQAMPLRDHFRPPLSIRRSWEGFHGQWPAMMVMALNRRLPSRFVAEPQVHLGSAVEVEVAGYDLDRDVDPAGAIGDGGGIQAAVWAPPQPTMVLETDLAE